MGVNHRCRYIGVSGRPIPPGGAGRENVYKTAPSSRRSFPSLHCNEGSGCVHAPDRGLLPRLQNAARVHTSSPYARRKNMKRATTLKLPKTTSNKRTDPGNPPWPEEMLGAPVLRRGRGPQKTPTKVLTTVRLDADVMAFFKSRGRGYQTRINEELRKVVAKGITPGSRRAQKRAA